jgi:LPS sulfotransferase NodH
LLDLCIELFGAERVQKIRNDLAGAPCGNFRSPSRILIMLFPSRSGSNYFGQLLSSTGWFNEIAESFNPAQLAKIRDRKGLGDLHEAAQWMIDSRGTPHAFGFKAGLFVLTAAAELGFLPEVIDRAQFVLLRRRDRVGQSVSLFKGKLGGRMHTRQPLERTLVDSDYDGEAIARELRNLVRTEDKLEAFVERIGKTAPLYHYEDICAEPEAHVAAVCDLMGLEMPWHYAPKKVRLGVLRDELSEHWCDRFRSEHPNLR